MDDRQLTMGRQILVSRLFFASSVAFLFSFSAIVAHVTFSGEASLLLTYFLALVTGYCLFRKSDALGFFTISFFVNTFFAVLFVLYFESNHGLPFSEGADDQAFYEISKKLKNGENVDFSALNYKAYVLTFSYYFKALNAVGIDSDYFFHLNILNSLFGALAAPLIFLIARGYTSQKNASLMALITLAYPPYIFYSATIIRDILVATLLFMIVYITIFRRSSQLRKIIILVPLFFFLYHIRAASAFLALFFISYYYLTKTNLIPEILLKATVICMVIGVIAIQMVSIAKPPPPEQPPLSDISNYLSYTSHYYRDLMVEQSDKNSIGVLIRTSENPALIFLSFVYMYFSPAPPLFVKSLELDDIFLGLGNLKWYYFALLFIIAAFLREKDAFKRRFQWAVILTVLLAVSVINFSSGDPRHFYFLQPLVMLVGLDYVSKNKRFFLDFTKAFALIFGFAGLVFVLLKLLR